MRIEFTISGSGAHRDVAVSAAGPLRLGAVRPALARLCGIPGDAALWSGDRQLTDESAIGGEGLRAGALVSVGSPVRDRFRPGILSLHVVGGRDAGRVVPLARGRFDVGRDTACDIVLDDADASRRHATIEVATTSVTVRDLGSTNGTRVEGVPVPGGGAPLRPGDVVRLGDTLLSIARPDDPPAALTCAADGSLQLHGPPRQTFPRAEEAITLPVRASAARPRGIQWVTALLPAFAGAAIAWLTHSPQFLLFALLSPIMLVSGSVGERLHWRRSRRRDAATFAQRDLAAQRQIQAGLTIETTVRRTEAPDPAGVSRIASVRSGRLWERNRGDADLLQVRLGTAELPSTLLVRDGTSLRAAGQLTSVPLCVDLRNGPLGIVGPAEVVAGLGRWLVGQLAVLRSPSALQLALLISPDSTGSWHWARWLPHLRGRVATAERQWLELVDELIAVLDQRSGSRRSDTGDWRGPWLVVVVDRAARVAQVRGLADVLERGRALGVTAIFLDVEGSSLPTCCSAVARVAGVTGTRVRVRAAGENRDTEAVLDHVSDNWAERVARCVAPLVEFGPLDDGALPAACRLSDVLGASYLEESAILENWAASDGGARTALGLCADGPCQLDLVADGPHALIAGTTGAGKSELLQTLVAGLAANHPPADVNFLLIDYKGGAAFADCALLPHTAGVVTDLDSYLTARALRSLNSELRRRERLFAECGVADLAAYRATDPAMSMSRLIIVVDEFASLAEELPDFIAGLVGVAQRGRSLGVHLVLATQRPGRAVSAEIRANTSIRIALRVTDASESTDVIDAGDAALIERSRPGRCYLRIGSTLTCVQAAHAGAPNRPDESQPVVELLGPWLRPPAELSGEAGRSDLAALVETLRAVAARRGDRQAVSPWLPPLPVSVARADLGDTAPTSIAFALVDLPNEQRRDTLAVDLADATSVLAAGAPRSGRTTLLSSLLLGAAERYAPDRLCIYVIDPAGGFAALASALPHCATVAGPAAPGLWPRLLRRLDDECARRVAERAGQHTSTDAAMLLLVDGWEGVLANLSDADAATCADLLAGLLRIGPAAGLTVAVSGDRTTLAPRLAGAFAIRLVLRLGDVGDYGLVGIAARDVPGSMPPGRALRAGDASVVQVAHPGSAAGPEDALVVASRVAASYRNAGTRPVNSRAIRIRPLPTRVPLDTLRPAPDRLSIGLAGDEAVALHIDPFAGAGRMLVAGPPRSGRSTLLRALLVQATAQGVATVVAAGSRSPLADAARDTAARLIDPADSAEMAQTLPEVRTLLLVDDSEAFVDTPVGDGLVSWLRATSAPIGAVVAGRSDDLATSYRGLGAEARRSHCGILLRPGPVDGELLGVRLPRRPSSGPPGRGVAIGDSSWGELFGSGEPVPVQVAQP